MPSKYIDKIANVMVLGGLIKDPFILERTEKYAISDEDFTDLTHRMTFLAINNLFVGGLKKIEVVDIVNYLQKSYPAEYLTFEKDDGVILLNRAVETSDMNKFDYYYQRMKKFTLLRTYDKFGIDVKDIYNINALDLSEKERQEKWLEQASLDDIVGIIDRKIDQVKMTAMLSGTESGTKAAEGVYNLLDRLNEFPEIGAALPFGIYNTVTAGARLKKVFLTSANTGVGKAIPDTTIIPMADGTFKKAKEIVIGDYVIGKNGKPTKITNIFKQGLKIPYELELADGRKAKCCIEHLWGYYYKNEYKVADTAQLIEDFNNGIVCLPINDEIEYPEKEYDIAPEKMGAMIDSGEARIDLLDQYLTGSIKQRKEFIHGYNPYLLELNKFSHVFRVLEEYKPFMSKMLRTLGYAVFNTSKDYLLVTKTYYAVQVVAIRELAVPVFMRCFTVDNDDALFLMNDYIVTHNTRHMIASACYLSCSQIYNNDTAMWEPLYTCEPTLYISTELDLEEVQTMILAFISGVNESKILNKESKTADEKERIYKAAAILEEAPLYINELPDFSINDIENTIKVNIEDHDVKYVFFDYIHTSLKILGEVSRIANGVRIREDNILFMLSIKLKDLANQYGVFIQTGTQTNALSEGDDDANASQLRGARAIADESSSSNEETHWVVRWRIAGKTLLPNSYKVI